MNVEKSTASANSGYTMLFVLLLAQLFSLSSIA